MEKIYKNPLAKKQKFSIDMDVSIVAFLNDLSKLTKSSRTMVIEAIIGKGTSILLDEMEKTWQGLLFKGHMTEPEKAKIQACLKELTAVREKWKKVSQ